MAESCLPKRSVYLAAARSQTLATRPEPDSPDQPPPAKDSPQVVREPRESGSKIPAAAPGSRAYFLALLGYS